MGKNYKAIVCIMLAFCLSASTDPSENAGYIFPDNTFPDRRGQKYSEVLEMMGEPSISTTSNKVDAYRFTFIHAFGDALAVRVQGGEGNPYTLHGVVYTETSETNELKRTTKTLKPEEVKEIKRLLRKSRFWKKPVDWRYTWKMKLLRKIRIVPQPQLDGSSWIMEAKEDGCYHVVDEWVGGRDENYVALCEYFVEISGLKPLEPKKHSYFRGKAK